MNGGIEKRISKLESVTNRFQPDLVAVEYTDGRKETLPWNMALLAVLDGKVKSSSGDGACADLVEVMLE